MDILTANAMSDTAIKGSRFIAELLLCTDTGEARKMLKLQKAKYRDATHVCHAFVLGKNGETQGMSDDGEPSGTAGRPILKALCARHCTGALLTVTRYFGGTLLGTGGLVRAYGSCAKSVIQAADAQCLFSPLVLKTHFSLSLPYSLRARVMRALSGIHIYNLHETFGDSVFIEAQVRADEAQKLSAVIRDATGGKADATITCSSN